MSFVRHFTSRVVRRSLLTPTVPQWSRPMSTQSRDFKRGAQESAEDTWEQGKQKAKTGWEVTKETVKDGVDAVKEAVGATPKDKAKRGIHNIENDHTEAGTRDLKDAAAQKGRQIKEKAAETWDSVKEAVGATPTDKAKRGIHNIENNNTDAGTRDLKNAAAQKGRQVKESAEETWEQGKKKAKEGWETLKEEVQDGVDRSKTKGYTSKSQDDQGVISKATEKARNTVKNK